MAELGNKQWGEEAERLEGRFWLTLRAKFKGAMGSH